MTTTQTSGPDLRTIAPADAVAQLKPKKVIPIPESADDEDLVDLYDHETSFKTKAINLTAVVLPFLGLIAAIVMLWSVDFKWVYLGLLVGMYFATAIGITVGFHRYFTHRSFETNRAVAFALAVLGSMAAQGSVLEWAAIHRRHHQHSDDEQDPHSPHTHGDTLAGTLRGVWHSHMGWLFTERPKGLIRYVGDLRKDRMVRKVSRHFGLCVLAGLIIPAVLGGLLTMSWMGALLGFIWGGLARVFLVHHVTWSVNSVCHIWGARPFKSHDESRNNVVFGVLAMGEGWHNNHHAFPTSARHGLRWWEFDISYIFIRFLGLIGLAHDIRVPTAERMAAKSRKGVNPSPSDDHVGETRVHKPGE